MMKKFSLKKRIQSFGFAFKGIAHVFAHEHNMWIHLCAALCVTVAGFYFHIDSTEWLFVLLCIGGVIAAELINSAIEKLVDLVSPQYNINAGLIKDIAAGAVLIMAIVSVIVGLIIFIPKLIEL
jgi:diacylglycerol kinase (ATP)